MGHLLIKITELLTKQNLRKQCQTWDVRAMTLNIVETRDYHSFAFDRFSKKSRMLDCLCVLSLKSTRTSYTIETAEDTLRNPDNRQTQQSDVGGRVLPFMLALLELVEEHRHCHHHCPKHSLFLSWCVLWVTITSTPRVSLLSGSAGSKQ